METMVLKSRKVSSFGCIMMQTMKLLPQATFIKSKKWGGKNELVIYDGNYRRMFFGQLNNPIHSLDVHFANILGRYLNLWCSFILVLLNGWFCCQSFSIIEPHCNWWVTKPTFWKTKTRVKISSCFCRQLFLTCLSVFSSRRNCVDTLAKKLCNKWMVVKEIVKKKKKKWCRTCLQSIQLLLGQHSLHKFPLFSQILVKLGKDTLFCTWTLFNLTMCSSTLWLVSFIKHRKHRKQFSLKWVSAPNFVDFVTFISFCVVRKFQVFHNVLKYCSW